MSMHYHELVFLIFSNELLFGLSFFLFVIYLYKAKHTIHVERDSRSLYSRAINWLIFSITFLILATVPGIPGEDQRALLRSAFAYLTLSEIGYNLFVVSDIVARIGTRIREILGRKTMDDDEQ